ncbi:MAG: hypothetical protein IH914_00575 [candidate division Zixibacteria bacterium]|nr:hypothetical protein [candidate division Zixibacteria bacterium]
MALRRAVIMLSLALAGLALFGCPGSRKSTSAGSVSERPGVVRGDKVLVDAYLFDMKVRDRKSRRTVRMDIYFADTIALITGRAYLGKGVGRGVWRPDSALFYFPTENEYYAGRLDRISDAGCLEDGPLQSSLSALFSGDIERVRLIEGLTVTQESDRRFEAELILGNCPGPLKLTFDTPGGAGRFYLKKFEYRGKDGKSVIKAKRRTIRLAREFDLRRFNLDIPGDALRLDW